MSIRVVQKRLFGFEVLAARGAGEGFYVGVHPLVHHEVTFALEALAARRTRKVILAC